MVSGLIHKTSGTDELNDFRTTMKILANILRVDSRIPKDRRYFMRRVTEEICEGSPRLHDIVRWYPQALSIANRKP